MLLNESYGANKFLPSNNTGSFNPHQLARLHRFDHIPKKSLDDSGTTWRYSIRRKLYRAESLEHH
jgi:hypothetical protein